MQGRTSHNLQSDQIQLFLKSKARDGAPYFADTRPAFHKQILEFIGEMIE